MAGVDLKTFVEFFRTELSEQHPSWDASVDAGATRTSAQLWANGYKVSIDLLEDRIEAHTPKFDELRMTVFPESREPLSEDRWTAQRPDALSTRVWRTINHDEKTRWRDQSGAELTIGQIYAAVKSEFCAVAGIGS